MIPRYNFNFDLYHAGSKECDLPDENGRWCEWSDVESIIAERDKMRQEKLELIELIQDYNKLVIDLRGSIRRYNESADKHFHLYQHNAICAEVEKAGVNL